MVRFEKDRFVIEVVTGLQPTEEWLGLIDQLTTLISGYEDLDPNYFWLVFKLLNDLMPDSETAAKMVAK